MDESGSGSSQNRAADSLVRLGAVLVAIGTLASIVALLPLFLSLGSLPVAGYLVCFCAPIGLGLILVGLWQSARSRTARLRASSPDYLS